MIVQFERQNGLCTSIEEPKTLINVMDSRRGTGSFGRGRGYNSKMCSHCGKPGHAIESCYKKHGYPPGYFNKFKGTKENDSVNAIGNEGESRFDEAGSSKETNNAGVMIPMNEYKEYQTIILLIKANSAAKDADQVQERSFAPYAGTLLWFN